MAKINQRNYLNKERTYPTTKQNNILSNNNLNKKVPSVKLSQNNNYNNKEYKKISNENNYVIQNNYANNAVYNRGSDISNNNSIYCVVYKNKPKEKKISNDDITKNANTKIYKISTTNNRKRNKK